VFLVSWASAQVLLVDWHFQTHLALIQRQMD